MSRSTAILLVLMTSSSAGASPPSDPPSAYGEIGAMARAGSMATPLLGVSLAVTGDGGYRLSRHLWFHAFGAVSKIADVEDSGDGTIFELRAGVEYHACSATGDLCLIPGFDVGGARGNWANFDSDTQSAGTVTDLVSASRLALDFGGDLRVRVTLEADAGLGRRAYSSGSDVTSFRALALELGFVFRM